MNGYGWMQPYLTTPPDRLAAAMRSFGAQGRLVSGKERFYIDWPGGCHMSTLGTKNAPPLVIDLNRTTGNTRAYCFSCCRPALDTVHALLGWKPDPGKRREKQSVAAEPQSRTGRQNTIATFVGSKCWQIFCVPSVFPS